MLLKYFFITTYTDIMRAYFKQCTITSRCQSFLNITTISCMNNTIIRNNTLQFDEDTSEYAQQSIILFAIYCEQFGRFFIYYTLCSIFAGTTNVQCEQTLILCNYASMFVIAITDMPVQSIYLRIQTFYYMRCKILCIRS